MQQNYADAGGLTNRAVGSVADAVDATNKFTPSTNLAGRFATAAAPYLPVAAAGTGVANLVLGGDNQTKGADRMANGESTLEKVAGGAQYAQGTVQQVAGGTSLLNAAATATGATDVAAATGKFLTGTAGPLIAGLDAGRSGLEAVQAYREGGDWETKAYYAAAKGTAATMMTSGNPFVATGGAGLFLGTAAGEQLNKLECVQQAQEKVGTGIADMFFGPGKWFGPPTEQQQEAAMQKRIQEAKARYQATQG